MIKALVLGTIQVNEQPNFNYESKDKREKKEGN